MFMSYPHNTIKIAAEGYMKAVEKEGSIASIEELGLEVKKGEVEIGGTYPIFGMLTSIEELENGNVIAKINYNITANLLISDRSRLDVLKSRAFETGIFVSTVISKEPEICVDCQAVIFGKPQAYNA